MTNPYPKLSKADRLREVAKRKSDLKDYRHIQARIAIDRDRSLCVFCYFLNNAEVNYQDVHHVYGRGRKAGDWREGYKHLVCTCREHHPLPIQTPGANSYLEWVEEVMVQANQTPINKNFNVE